MSFFQDPAADFYISTFQTNDDRDSEFLLTAGEELGRFYDAGRDDVALIDAAKNIDQDAVYLIVFEHDVESSHDFFWCGVAADVQEVCRFAAVFFDDVHGSHSEACAIDHASHVAAQIDIVQSFGSCLSFLVIFFGDVAKRYDFRMAGQGAVIEIELRIKRHHVAFLGDHQRIHFSQGTIFIYKNIVQVLHESRCFSDSWFFEMERIRHAQRLEISKADDRVDVFLNDFFRCLCCYVFNRHAATFRAHHDHALRLAIHQEGQVIFFFDMAARFDEEAIYLLALGASLASDQSLAQEFLGIFLHVVQRLGDLDAPRFPAAAGMDLRLHHHDGRIQTHSVQHRILYSESRVAFRHVDAIFAHNLLALVFMDIHNTSSLPWKKLFSNFRFFMKQYTHQNLFGYPFDSHSLKSCTSYKNNCTTIPISIKAICLN